MDSQEEDKVIIDENFVKEYSSDITVIKFIQSKFKRLSTDGAINLIKMLIWKQVPIKMSQIITKKSFYQYNISKFDKEKNLKLDAIKSLRLELNGFLVSIGKDLIEYDKTVHDTLSIDEKTGEHCFILEKNTLYKKVRKLVCDEIGNVCFRYNFNKPDLEVTLPENKNTLQRCNIQILSTSIKFDYPIEYVYSCPQCGNITSLKAYQTASTNGKLKCPGIESYVGSDGEPKSRRCLNSLYPDEQISVTKDAYYYDINYEDSEGNKYNAGTFSFDKYSPGFYECVLFRIMNPKKTELYHITDIKEIKSNVFPMPPHNNEENYLFTLQKAMDEFIRKNTGMEIYGMFPIKVSMIIQKMFKVLGPKLISNIQVVGDASTGKSTTLKYYSFLLNKHLNMTTNGLSCSIAGLRGTRHVISLMGKEQKIITAGQLGTFHTIHIDEAGENKELVKHLKTFLLEENYSYDKAGSEGIFRKRTAHVNVSENLDYAHLGQYRGSIKKAYKELNIKIGEEEMPEWDESWDLHLPIFKYDNLYLRKVIKEKRIEYQLKQIFWIDGYDYALHERFPFYFYLVNERNSNKLFQIIKGNVARETIEENLELIRALKNDSLDKFFNSLKKYVKSESDIDNFQKVDTILEQYGLHFDARMRIFYYNLVKMSRIINKRMEIIDMDLELLKWILENTNCKIDVSDTTNYNIIGPPDIEKSEELDKKIEDETKEGDGMFGMPEDEFSQN